MAGQAPGFLASPRRRRRLKLLLLVFALAVVVAALIAFERNTAKPTATPVTKGTPYVPPAAPHSHRFTKAEAKVVLGVAMRFVSDAVGRKDMHSAWSLTAPVLRGDTSRSDWDRGENTEIAPFAFQFARWKLDYNYPRAVGLEVAVYPKKNSEIKSPMVYYMELQKQRRDHQTHWLVDQWVPAPGSAQVVQGAGNPLAGNRSTPDAPGLGAVWLAVPAAIVGLILAIPLGLGLREWRRGRRARREYDSTLPSLSQYGSGNS